MATLKKATGAQYPLRASFEFNIASGDVMLDTTGALTAIGKATGKAYDIVPLPFGAQVIGGDLIVHTVGNDTNVTAVTVSVGDSASAARYLAATSIEAAARTALVPTGYKSLGEAIRLTFANGNGDATTGKVQVMVEFVMAETRQNENLKTT